MPETKSALLELVKNRLADPVECNVSFRFPELKISNVTIIWEDGTSLRRELNGSYKVSNGFYEYKTHEDCNKLKENISCLGQGSELKSLFDKGGARSIHYVQLPLYIMNQKGIENLANNSDPLARDPSDKYNILHWLIDSFIPTQQQTLESIRKHSYNDSYLNITFTEMDGRFTYELVYKKQKALESGAPLKIASIDISCTFSVCTHYKDKKGFINIEKIISNPISLYCQISKGLNEKDIGNLFMTQDTHGNTPLHLLLTQSGKADKGTAYDDLLNYLLNKVVPKLSAKVKVKLLCTQNNDGNNILHMVEDCHGAQLWNGIYNTFGHNAFVYAKIQLNNNHDIPAASSNTCPGNLAVLSPKLEPDQEPSGESGRAEDAGIVDGEEAESTFMSANSIDSDQYMSANSIDSDQYVDASIGLAHMFDNHTGVSDKKINSNQKSTQQLIQIKNLVNRKEALPIEVFSKYKLSANDLLLEYRDGSTIFGTIIAHQLLELIGHCIENVLSPWELYDFHQRNSQEVESSITHNPNISLPEWKKLYDSQTIVIQLFDYLSHRRSKKSTLQSLLGLGEDLDFITRQDACLGLLRTLCNCEFSLPEPSLALRDGKLSRKYYNLHLRLYNLAQAMTVDERKDTFLRCFSTYGYMFTERDQYLAEKMRQYFDPYQQPTPSAPSSCLDDKGNSNTEELGHIPVVTATPMTSLDDRRSLPVGTIFPPHKEGEEEKTTDHKNSNCIIS